MRKSKSLFLIPILLLCLLVSCNTDIADYSHSGEVFVESEFAPLKRVVLSQSEWTDTKLKLSDSYFTEEEILKYGIESDGEYLYFKENTKINKAAEKERNSLKKLLEDYGVEVIMPRKLTDEERKSALINNGPTNGMGMSNFFVRDTFSVIGGNILEMNPKKEYRRYEITTVRDILQGEYAAGECTYNTIPEEYSDSFLEGGDILVWHNKVFVGNSGYASNKNGYNWLKETLKESGYDIVEVELKGEILHLDCVISLVREGLMIVCEDCLKNGIPEELRDWDKIVVSEKDAQNLAVNGMAINEDVYITDIEFRDTVGAELEKRGIKTEYIDFAYTRLQKGSIHCTVNPLLRK